jgi:hypothetical protein
VLEIQLPAIYRARSTAPNGEHGQVDESAGLPEDHVLGPSARRFRTLPPPLLERDVVRPHVVRPRTDVVPIEEDVVPIDELLDWDGADDERPTEIAVGRLASLLGIAAVAVAVLAWLFAAGTEVMSLFRSLPGS